MPNVAVEALVMFVIKAKAGTHAVSCHIVALAWETCQQEEEEEAGEEKKRALCFILFAWKEIKFYSDKLETPPADI